MEKRFWVVLIVIVAVLAGVFVLTKPKDNKPTANIKNNGNLNTVQTYDHVRGSKDNKVVLVEYGDFQCPYCEAYYPFATTAFKRYGSVVTFVYRPFPLTQIHPNAMAAARAAEAAGLQGKFWEMHDKLYDTQSDWADNTQTAAGTFADYAKGLGLNMDKFNADYAGSEVNDRINNFIDNGNSQGVTGTPTLFLNGAKIEPPTSTGAATDYYQQIEAAIKKAGLKVPSYDSNS